MKGVSADHSRYSRSATYYLRRGICWHFAGLRPAIVAVLAALLIVTGAACGSGSPGASGSSSPSAGPPLTQAQLIAGSKHEKGLLIYSNALLTQMNQVVKAFQAKYPWIQRHCHRR